MAFFNKLSTLNEIFFANIYKIPLGNPRGRTEPVITDYPRYT